MVKTDSLYQQALFIRKVEESLLKLFAEGKLNGVAHTCVGQEFTAVVFVEQLKKMVLFFLATDVMGTIMPLGVMFGAGVKIEDNTIIGMNATVLKG